MNTKLHAMYHTGSCPHTIDQLVNDYAPGLVAAAQANAKHGRAEEAFLFSEAHVLVVGSRRAFQKKRAEYTCYVRICPLGCRLTASWRILCGGMLIQTVAE